MTHTYAILEVPATTYAAIRALLASAGHGEALHDEHGGEVIDMHGIALRARAGGPPCSDIVIGSLLSSRTKDGRVEMAVNGELVQMDLDKAREVSSMLQRAIEAAVSDALIYRFLVEKVGMEADRASMALLDFRELRQGSRDVVRPN